MKIKVTHSTTYKYSSTVPKLIQCLKLHPTSCDNQEILEWKVFETGFVPRVSLHIQELSYVDLYAFGFIGPTFGQINAELSDRNAKSVIRAPGLRGGLGFGGNLVAKYGILLGAELRYEIGARFLKETEVSLTDSTGATVAWTAIERHQRPPRGFSWVFNLGKRF